MTSLLYSQLPIRLINASINMPTLNTALIPSHLTEQCYVFFLYMDQTCPSILDHSYKQLNGYSR